MTEAAAGRVAVAPEGARVVSPSDEAELAEFLRSATQEGTPVAIWGAGTHRQIGHPTPSDAVVSTRDLTGIVDWQPDDLTVVVRAGTTVSQLEEELVQGGQTAVLPEQAGLSTVGGVVATGVSAYGRLRYGPTRDRMLQVKAVTGDGRVVQGGGRVVKNVSGYDLPRLYTGSMGSLGVITEVCLKLWPVGAVSRTVDLETVPSASAVYRPRAVLETRDGVRVYLSGSRAEVEDQVGRLGGRAQEGLLYPEPLTGDVVWSCRVRPKHLTEAVSRIPESFPFVAQHGVGEVSFAAPASFDVTDLRAWVESLGGSLVRTSGDSNQDPWGTPPTGLDIQRRLIEAFDPRRILEPGRLPGGL